jgi:hypothetical protein
MRGKKHSPINPGIKSTDHKLSKNKTVEISVFSEIFLFLLDMEKKFLIARDLKK